MIRRAFTLFELLLAMVISTLLIGGILVVCAGLSRDRQRLASRAAQIPTDGLSALLTRDLASAVSPPASASNAITLRSHHALDPATLKPTGRLCQVSYRLHQGHLVREQQLIDDLIAKANPPTRHLLMTDVISFSLLSESGAYRYRVHLQQSQHNPVTFDVQAR